ncbi:MAG: hypothetical protein SAJ37_19735 [Oscillatoria sp. PMC 1068.18]|nr:hypothetical protein [Oscillatoria sp. PMC 1076.18]MEC4990970.1 hypothetical protein [Oscillatoria sp. PMC 1068.18]
MLYPEYLPNSNQDEALKIIYLAEEEETQPNNKETEPENLQMKETIMPLITPLELLMRPV